MLRLSELSEENWREAASLSVKEEQKEFVAPAIGIIARGYVYRGCRGRVFVLFTDEPLGYDLQQFMIDRRYQGRGFGSRALDLILNELKEENRWDHVEVCVKKKDTEAIRLYEKHGFRDSGYVDEDVPDAVNMVCRLTEDRP